MEPDSQVQPNTQENFSQHERALVGLRTMLLKGEFRPGDRIAEVPLAAKLGVSRTPLRLALERLQNEGLLEAIPSGGFAVCKFSLEDVWDAIEVRGVLEGTVARLAAERLSDVRQLEKAKAINEDLARVLPLNETNFSRYVDLNKSFHVALLDLVESRILRRSLEQVYWLPFASPTALVFGYLQIPEARDSLLIGLEQHRAILDAIEHREGTRAESIAREHTRLARRNLQLALANEPTLGSIPGASLIRVAGA
jgi:GntR family transcriptional regulator of vanillate catabolism